MRRLTTEQFVERAISVHGYRYDYSKSEYKGNRSKLVIICHKHGEFLQLAHDHVNGSGCPCCAFDLKRTKTKSDGASKKQSYVIWHAMMRRGLNDKQNFKSYTDVTICDEWRDFEKFDLWFNDNYRDGLHLDKDLLSNGNKIYSPDTCCFIPQKLNSTLHSGIGVYKRGDKFRTRIYIDGVMRIMTYSTEEEARCAYEKSKKHHITELAKMYYKDGVITERVYIALLNYKVERA